MHARRERWEREGRSSVLLPFLERTAEGRPVSELRGVAGERGRDGEREN